MTLGEAAALGIRLPSLPLWVAAHDDLHRSRRIRTVFDGLVEGLRTRFRG